MTAATRHRIAKQLGFTNLKEGRYFRVLSSLRDGDKVACMMTLRDSTRNVGRLYWTLSLDNGLVTKDGSGDWFGIEKDLTTCLILWEAEQLRKEAP